jgi:hypothetical protein
MTTLKKLTARLLPNTITIRPTSIEATHQASIDQYGRNAIEIWLTNPNYKINAFTMIMLNGWAYEVLDMITPTAFVIRML